MFIDAFKLAAPIPSNENKQTSTMFAVRDRTCRTCLGSRSVSESEIELAELFEPPSPGGLGIPDMLAEITPLRVTENDGLPSTICSECLKSARSALAFKRLCEESDAELRSRLGVDPSAVVKRETFPLPSERIDFDEDEPPVRSSPEPKIKLEPSAGDPKRYGKSAVCEICDQSFAHRQTLTRHMKIHRENAKNKLCTFCGKSFSRADDLKRHTRIHTGERPYSCDRCPKKYKQSSELKDHMKSHSAAKSYVCTECGKSLATRNGLYVHMKVHRGEKNRECKICGNRFVTNGELNSHINHIHSGERPHECPHDGCPRAFTTKLSLKTHLRAHTGEKPYRCAVCGKSLATSSSLHEHRRIHTGEKPKKCNICERRLGNSQALKKHMRLHTGERPYQCSVCFEKFICASALNAHVKIKHAEKQHECTVCHKMFALGTKLRQHMRLHPERKTSKCDYCQESKPCQHSKMQEAKIETDRADEKQITMTQLNVSNIILSHYM